MSEITRELIIDQTLVDQFAEWTGDFSPLHTDRQFARRTRFRSPVAHGMISVLMLDAIADQFSDPVSLLSLKIQFKKPVAFDSGVCMVLKIDAEAMTFDAEWFLADSGELLTKGSGTLANQTAPALVDAPSGRYELANWQIDALKAQPDLEVSLAFEANRASGDGLVGVLNGTSPKIGNLRSVMQLSTLVGMRLPGKYAIFSGFRMEFDHDTAHVDAPQQFSLTGRLASVDELGSSLKASIELLRDDDSQTRIAQGDVTVLVGEPSQLQPSYEEVKSEWAKLVLPEVAVVVGASRGIGEATVKVLASLGSKVAFTYHLGKDDAEQICQDIVQGGGEALAVQCDIRDPQEVASLFSMVKERWGEVGLLVNCAVYSFETKAWADTTWDDFTREFEVSIAGMHNACIEAIRHMEPRRQGKIINISSTVFDAPTPGHLSYTAAKGAVLAYSRSLAKELTKRNIQVNVVTPAMTETDLVSELSPSLRKRISAAGNASRQLIPTDIARAIAFLGSNWSDGMTGQQLVINNGSPPYL